MKRKQVKLIEVKGTDYSVNGEAWGTYIPETELKDMEKNPNE